MRIGVLASTGHHIDSFFPEIFSHWRSQAVKVVAGAGTPSHKVTSDVIPSITRRPTLRSSRALQDLNQWSRSHELDVVLTNTATASFLARAAITDVPVVYFAHGLHWSEATDLKSLPWRSLERIALPRTSGVVTINDEDDEWFRKHAPSLPKLRLQFGVGLDTAAYPRTPMADADMPRLVWVGELSNRKNPMHALNVALELEEAARPYELRILGKGTLTAKLSRSIGALGLAERVHLVGHVPVAGELRRATALIHTASWEGLPRVFLEAISTGRPVVSYDIKGARNLPGVRTVPYGDYTLLANVARRAHEQWNPDILPDPSALSYKRTADHLLTFLRTMAHR